MAIEMVNRNRKYTVDQERKIVDMYTSGKSSYYISNKIGIPSGTVHAILKRNGVICRKTRKFNEDEEKDVIELYKKGSSINTIATKYHSSQTAVSNVLIRNNKDRRSFSESNRKYKINDTFFDEINTKERAYFLGFLFADGCNNEPYYIALDLKEQDSYILERFRALLYPSVKSRPVFNNRVHPNGKKSIKFTISSKKMSEKLSSMGLPSNKSLNLRFPFYMLNNPFLNHFIRGYFDGDGSIVLTKRQLNFIGTTQFLSILQDIFVDKLGIKKTKIRFSLKESDIKFFSISNLIDMKKVIEYMYSDSDLFLKRKKSRCFNLLERIENGELKPRIKTSKYKGVSLDRKRNKWMVWYKGKNYGRFDTEEIAYNKLLKVKKNEKVSERS